MRFSWVRLKNKPYGGSGGLGEKGHENNESE
jgi:hypothetical protein